jgi:hypothetical protein
MRQTTTRPAYGEVDCFELAGLDLGRELPCSSPRSLLYYICSPSASKAVVGHRAAGSFAEIHVTGPIADDERPLRVRYRMTHEDLHVVLCEDERELLYGALARFGPADDPDGSMQVGALKAALLESRG